MAGLVKICGVKTEQGAIAAAARGADLVGFVFVGKNPRYIAPDAAEEIVTQVKRASDAQGFAVPRFAGVFVDAGEKLLAETAPFLTHFQFHGHEDAERVAEIGAEFGVETIRAIPARSEADLQKADEFAGAADLLLFDARPGKIVNQVQSRPTGTQWGFLQHYRGATPFLLTGGLNPKNVAKAIADAKKSESFAGVDVSSGVEAGPGEKDAEKVAAFIKTARGAM